jgi:hypothetical protein
MTRRSLRRWRVRCNRALRRYRAAGNVGRWRPGHDQTVALRLCVHAVLFDKAPRAPMLWKLAQTHREAMYAVKEWATAWSGSHFFCRGPIVRRNRRLARRHLKEYRAKLERLSSRWGQGQ